MSASVSLSSGPFLVIPVASKCQIARGYSASLLPDSTFVTSKFVVSLNLRAQQSARCIASGESSFVELMLQVIDHNGPSPGHPVKRIGVEVCLGCFWTVWVGQGNSPLQGTDSCVFMATAWGCFEDKNVWIMGVYYANVTACLSDLEAA